MPSSHWGRATLMRYAGTLVPRMQRWVGRRRVISTLLFAYPQVCEYNPFHFYAWRLAMHLSVSSASTPRSPSTEATKGVKY